MHYHLVNLFFILQFFTWLTNVKIMRQIQICARKATRKVVGSTLNQVKLTPEDPENMVKDYVLGREFLRIWIE